MPAVAMRKKASLLIVGCGTPSPTPERFGSCLVLTAGGERLMFDCGPAATHKLVKSGIAPTEIEHLFFTHHHYDHNADTPCFLLCRWDHERPGVPPLKVYGPAPTAAFTACTQCWQDIPSTFTVIVCLAIASPCWLKYAHESRRGPRRSLPLLSTRSRRRW